MTDKAFDGKKIFRSEEEWRKKLTPAQFNILREKGTEPPFANEYYHQTKSGIYYCRGCMLSLFSSKDKYDSGSGWPSFTKPINEINIVHKIDKSHSMIRMEVKCARCNGHLGHVFDDGPIPSNKRYCINSTALEFKCAL